MINDGDIAAELHLDEGETFLLAALQLMMLDRDIAAEKRAPEAKIAARDSAAVSAVGLLDQLSDSAPAWIRAYVESCNPITIESVPDAPAELCGNVIDRERAVLLMIELLLFSPWADGKTKWVEKERRHSLRVAAGMFPNLRDDDLPVMERESAAIMRRLRRASLKWGRVAVVSVAGLGAGLLTAGWAAPAIGAAVGGAMGLSGAAATSAGLAALGGGSLAAGGFGVAGGTALLTGLGGVAGASVGAAGARLSQRTAGQVITDAIKLDLVARMIFDEDDEKARRVAESLQQRIVELATLTNRLADEIRELSKDKARLTAENRELRKRLRQQYEQTQLAETALDIVVDRLSDDPSDADDDTDPDAALTEADA
ncbi:hypothetical protein [Nocardia cyriacigeorgica]|uniref:Uncharacterized protein n=1 Tax=Nocardia cyriacigeorgica TaxID=135487 RepID=A0A5R8NZV5_9NOCA|nr:hypothetical protein [Nocardia cyriacigeorgica]TLF80932.1 hypothetical protein FEK34_04455 [Nocardia cyriacigeorgica]